MESQLNSENQIDRPVVSEFSEIVKESKENIASAESVPVKGRAGRKKLPRDGSGKIIRDGKRVSGGEASNQSVTNQGTPSPSSPPPDISKHLIAPIIGISKIPAIRYRVPELVFTADEAGLVAHSFQEVLNAFVPDVSKMSPRTAAVLSFGVVVGSIGFSKYQIFLEKRPRIEKKPEPLPEEKAGDGQVFPTIPAEMAFRKNQ